MAFRITHVPTKLEGEGRTQNDALRALIQNPGYRNYMQDELKKRGNSTGRTLGDIVFAEENLMGRAQSILALGQESGVLKVERV